MATPLLHRSSVRRKIAYLVLILVLFVVTTLRSERTCRIISARRATRHEQDRYYAGDREAW